MPNHYQAIIKLRLWALDPHFDEFHRLTFGLLARMLEEDEKGLLTKGLQVHLEDTLKHLFAHNKQLTFNLKGDDHAHR